MNREIKKSERKKVFYLIGFLCKKGNGASNTCRKAGKKGQQE